MNGFSRMARRVRGSHGCRYGLVALGLLLCWGCASASSGSGFSERQQDQRNIQLTIRNENATPITVFVWWQGGRRVRLGDLSGVSTRTFTTAARDGGIWFEVEDQTTFTRRASSPARQLCPRRAGGPPRGHHRTGWVYPLRPTRSLTLEVALAPILSLACSTRGKSRKMEPNSSAIRGPEQAGGGTP